MFVEYKIWLIVVAIFIAIDIISGLIKAFYNKSFSSNIMRQGIYHKITYILIIIVAITCEYASNNIDLGFDLPLIKPTCAYITVCEFMSILENISAINPELSNYTSKFLSNIDKK